MQTSASFARGLGPRPTAAPLLALAALFAFSVPAGAQSYRPDAGADVPSERAPFTAAADLPVEGAHRVGFASEIAVGDGEVFVGEPRNQIRPGMVYVFRTGPGGEWTEVARLTAPEGEPGDAFGSELAVEGRTLLVSATPSGDEPEAGRVYVFRKDAESGEWSHVGQIEPDSARAGFGTGLALQGGLAYVGTVPPGGNDEPGGPGSVAVFRWNADGGEWSSAGTLRAREPQAGGAFGAEIVAEDDLLLIAAVGRDSARGSVLVFRSDQNGGWIQADSLRPPRRGSQGGAFGISIASAGNRILIGAPGNNAFTGAVYAFVHDEEDGAWEREARLLPFDGGIFTQFGASVAAEDEDVFIGAPGAGGGDGRIYRYTFDPASERWSAGMFAASPPEDAEAFGQRMELRDGVLAVGMPRASYGTGAALIYTRAGESDRWNATARVMGEIENYAAVTGERVRCASGEASAFSCQAVDLLSFLPVQALGGARGVELNDVWGWTDPESGREYALVGRVDGTSFVDVTDPLNPVYLGDLPMTEGAHANVWRDIKVYDNHAFIVADGSGEHGMQVFDLTRLRDVEEPPVTFTEDALYTRIHSAHNIVIDTASGFAYAVGSSGGGTTCGGGLHMIDIREPENPTFAGCFADTSTGRQRTGYTHDAQCVVYHGPDEEYRGRQICIGNNETALSIADVTDKENPVAISTVSYPDYGYVHQGWLTEDHEYFYQDDELDERQGTVDRTRTLIWDVRDLDDPILVGEFLGETPSIDHNLYIVGDRMYQSNYVAGLRVIDISDREDPVEVGYFDTVPYGDDSPSFNGSWSNYPFFDSGTIVVTSGREGLFLVQDRRQELVP